MRSSWAAVLVILALLAPGAHAFAALDPHGCTDHVCYCKAPRPQRAKRASATPACHQTAEAHASDTAKDADCWIRGACRHDVPQLASQAPFLTESPAPGRVLAPVRARLAGFDERTDTGFSRIDPRPPRLRS